MPKRWTPASVLALSGSFQRSCLLLAAAELGVFDAVGRSSLTAADVASRLGADRRATTMLLDALVAIDLLDKPDETYRVPARVAELLTETGQRSVLPMVRHHASCLRRWVQLASVVQSGRPAERTAGVRGPQADQEAFIGAMHVLGEQMAGPLVAAMGRLRFRHLLDVGGGSGTYTIAFLRAAPRARATLFDLPAVIPMAEQRLRAAGLLDRVRLVAGDFDREELPGGADLAWVSAIIHQNSRQENRVLYGKVFRALEPGGAIVIRDVVMEPSRTEPRAGAVFAINMLVATSAGGTYTFDEIREDLQSAGFQRVQFLRRGEFMDSLVRARKA